jgi:hypothetical protein
MEGLEFSKSGSWQDWVFVAGYLSMLLFVMVMVLAPKRN